MANYQPVGIGSTRSMINASDARSVFDESLSRARTTAELGTFISLAEREPIGGRGRLAGVPFAVKDNIDTADLPTSAGTPALRNSRPGRDHVAVQRLRQEGAALLGKTNLHELAFGVTSNNAAFGPVRNPYDPSRSAGGSSGGSAVAVATGCVPFALGTDTGASVRLPASYCGVVGWRPTVGRWGSDGMVPVSRTRDTVGAMATSVADILEVDRIVTRERFQAPLVNHLRLGVPDSGFFDDLDPEVATTVGTALDQLADAGVELVELDFSVAHELDEECGFPIVLFEMARDLPRYLEELPGVENSLGMEELINNVASPDVKSLLQIATGGACTPSRYQDLLAVRERLRHAYRHAMTHDGRELDALIYPTSPLLPPPVGDDDTTELCGRQVPVFPTASRNTRPGSTAGMPSITLPCGRSSAGLPVGVSLESLPFNDDALLHVAGRIERVLSLAT
ncbi:amidase family protein [Rhodococcus artemisiae]|uniref:Amidase family protein n=1 Tax=Rhodococcus artemisiae TaxID=714159 RepID=A0ABU7LC57_9NOCA|nr:amidase family protein [Rhodococcus artemisiae]MEE2059128.1 amidase family protein [Rhodococcus artemisiae]